MCPVCGSLSKSPITSFSLNVLNSARGGTYTSSETPPTNSVSAILRVESSSCKRDSRFSISAFSFFSYASSSQRCFSSWRASSSSCTRRRLLCSSASSRSCYKRRRSATSASLSICSCSNLCFSNRLSSICFLKSSSSTKTWRWRSCSSYSSLLCLLSSASSAACLSLASSLSRCSSACSFCNRRDSSCCRTSASSCASLSAKACSSISRSRSLRASAASFSF